MNPMLHIFRIFSQFYDVCGCLLLPGLIKFNYSAIFFWDFLKSDMISIALRSLKVGDLIWEKHMKLLVFQSKWTQFSSVKYRKIIVVSKDFFKINNVQHFPLQSGFVAMLIFDSWEIYDLLSCNIGPLCTEIVLQAAQNSSSYCIQFHLIRNTCNVQKSSSNTLASNFCLQVVFSIILFLILEVNTLWKMCKYL